MQAAAKAELASLVKDHLTSLVREAICVQRHAKRARFHQTSDDDDGIIRHRLHADDINLALQWRGSNVLYATGTVIPRTSDSQKRVDLNSYLRDEMQERPPSEIGLTLHWLAVDGEQPRIPQNPPTTSMANRVEEEEDEENYNDDDMHVDDYISDNQTNEDVNNNNNSGYSSHSTAIHRTTTKPMEDVQVRQLLPRLVSEELQLYFSQITLALERGGSTIEDRQAQDDALERVAKDSGLQELVPFWVQYLVQHLHCHMGHPEHCRTLIRLARSLLNNPYLHLELQLHQLLPAIITHVVAKKLTDHPDGNHWALRIEAAQVLHQACTLFGDKYASLKATVLKKLVQAIDLDRPLVTIFGGLMAISYFGSKAVSAFILPVAVPYWEEWSERLNETEDPRHVEEIHQCQNALLTALGVLFRSSHVEDHAKAINSMADLFTETFGDHITPLRSDTNVYSMCFL